MKYLVGSRFYALSISLLIFSLSVVVYAEPISPDKAAVGEVVDIALFGSAISGDHFVWQGQP